MTTKRKLIARATGPQTQLVNSTAHFPAFVGGFGSGKTQALMLRALRLKLRHKTLNIAYYLPTYDLVKLIGYPRFEQMLENARIPYSLNRSEHVLKLRGAGNIIFRTLDSPERIVGYEVADSLVDELDTMKLDAAAYCWRQILARNRQKKQNGEANTIAVGTTPEGFRFVHKRWVKRGGAQYELIPASTYSNLRNLPVGYIESLQEDYSAPQLQAYIDGKFVNLVSGSVHPEFCRVKNHTNETIRDNEALHIGMDFNVYNMAATISVIRAGLPLTLGELTGVRDTPAMIDTIKQKYAKPGRSILIYPDASGDNKSSKSASLSDISLLNCANFNVVVDASNPRVKDRVLSMNGMILNAAGVRRHKVNTDLCPVLTDGLEQQAYDKNGEPDKSTGHDHIVDANGYFISKRYPIERDQLRKIQIGGA
ncbi:MAG: hypothetical protein A3I66_01365 [Burkholderiales bacterium RIFCSPLOWO2_02_FULL_57_36]|nr:MAG: hypothetical protein A3I66_01365 [Burkholderiales bacterium RIFCSPLOWO2_02_FULL_57_36]